jgi:hypothetical protein
MKLSHRFRPLPLLLMTVAVALVLGGCGNSSDDSSGPSDSSSSSSSSGGTSDSDQDSSDDSTYDDTAEAETTSEEPTDENDDKVGSNNKPSGDGLSGDELAANISQQYQAQWEELFGMPMDDEDAPVRCDALEAELDATTDCEVDMGGSAWMPLDVTVTAVTPVGIEYQVMPSLGG